MIEFFKDPFVLSYAQYVYLAIGLGMLVSLLFSETLGVMGGGLHGKPAVYDAERIIERSKIIKLAIEARKLRFPDEQAFEYKPLSASTEDFTWNAAARKSLHDYNLLDLSI